MKSCEFDIGLSVPRMRSIRVNGISTCFRLEEIYWRILDDIARRDHVSISVLVSSWARHVDLRYGGVPNLSSYIRICCLMHICGKAQRAARDPREERGRSFTDSNWPAAARRVLKWPRPLRWWCIAASAPALSHPGVD